MLIFTINRAKIDKHSLFIINNKNNNNKQRKNMNNFKKIGMTALAASLVSTSVFAGEMTVTGSASIGYENYKADVTAPSASKNGTKTFSMGNQITFSGSGELDNGLSVALSFVLDQGDDADAVDGPFDNHSITVSSDTFGKLQFFGEGGDSAQNAVGDTAAGNIWDTFDGTDRGGGTSELKESNSGSNFLYTLPSMVDGLTVMASYLPAYANNDSDTAYAVTYAGIDGLSVSYGKGSNDELFVHEQLKAIFKRKIKTCTTFYWMNPKSVSTV